MKSTMTINRFGHELWHLNDELHREDGPAIIYPSGGVRYLLHGKLHREDGPAVTFENKREYWYINGKYLTKEKVVSLKLKFKELLK